VVTLAGLTSIGWMAIMNFMINSDFKWVLLAFNLPWIIALSFPGEKADTLERKINTPFRKGIGHVLSSP